MSPSRLCALAAVALCAALSFAQEPTENLAVMEFGGNGISASDLAGLSNRLRVELFNTGRFTVIERSRMEDILKEQGFQRTGCTNTECAVEIGQLVGVREIVVGSIDKVAETYAVNVRMVDVATGKIRVDVAVDCDACGLADVLKTTIRNAARRLAGLEAPAATTGSQSPPAEEVAAPALAPGPRIVEMPGYYRKDGVDMDANTVLTAIEEDSLVCPQALPIIIETYTHRQLGGMFPAIFGGIFVIEGIVNGSMQGNQIVTGISIPVGGVMFVVGMITAFAGQKKRTLQAIELYNNCPPDTASPAATPAPVKKRQGYRGR